MGKAVVSTSIGSEGLAVANGSNIVTSDRPEEFAAGVHKVLTDKELRIRLGQNARDTAERYYSWEVIGCAMLRSYNEVLASSGARSPTATDLRAADSIQAAAAEA
jgi:glycosyltransferase involved in cell wall biosynthesis